MITDQRVSGHRLATSPCIALFVVAIHAKRSDPKKTELSLDAYAPTLILERNLVAAVSVQHATVPQHLPRGNLKRDAALRAEKVGAAWPFEGGVARFSCETPPNPGKRNVDWLEMLGTEASGLPGQVWDLADSCRLPKFARKIALSHPTKIWEYTWKSQTSFYQTSATTSCGRKLSHT